MRPRRALLAFGCTVLAGGAPAAATPLFVGLGDLPGGSVESRAAGISGDGTTVVGFSSSAASGAGAFTEVFRWTASEGMQGLGIVGPNPASAVSADGSVVVGTIWNGGFQVYRWTEPSGLQPIYVGQGKDVSADGSVVVGDTFRWSATTGLAFLGDLPGGINFTLARAVSAAGDIVVGSAFSAAGQEAFRWTASTGMVGLGDLSGGAVKANANGISADGSTLVGDGEIDGGKSVPLLWTEAGGFVALGASPGSALDASADGSVVVGTSGGFAFVWDAQHGMRSLPGLLVDELGLDLTGWLLDGASAISDDGRTITGTGLYLGTRQAWVAVIPEPGTLSLLALGLGMLGLRRRPPAD